jgi:methylmalonyl-CoA/ethylmalonyl-CoA epimerase
VLNTGPVIPNLPVHRFSHEPLKAVKLEHIGIAVADIDASLTRFRDLLGAEPYKVEEVLSEGVRTHFFDAGGTKIELLESTAPDSPVARFLEKRGPGLHHLAFASEDIDADWARLEQAGYALIGSGPKPGADGKTIFFVHPKDTEGVLTEFCY